jgi:23S rRNA (adenine2503-C2)-methyltransferase
VVLGEDAGLHGPESRGIRTRQEREQKRLPHASPTSCFRDVDRVRDDAGVRPPWRDAPEDCPADDLAALDGHETVVRQLRPVPGFPLRHRGLERGEPRVDALPVNGCDSGPVRLGEVSDDDVRPHGRYLVKTVDLPLLEETLAERDQPRYRTGQVWAWAARGAVGYEEMTNLPAGLRAELAEAVPFSTLALESEARSSDGTVKALFRTREGHAVEAVLMRYRDGRRSLCLSSQSGCPLTCTFCATGQMRFGRNLTTSEILDQALHFRRFERVDHAVFMGMGEPMLNFDHMLAAARRLPDLGITHRRTTISTVGWIPGLRRFVEEVEEPIRLAISLHAPDDELRSRIMPVNDRYPLSEILALCNEHHRRANRKVFVEYVMLAGVNDRVAQAAALAGLLDPKVYKVNLIPYNPTGMYEGSSRDTIAAFKHVLDRARLPATVRLTRGRDIGAACGQLAAASSLEGGTPP